jgi:hypothetical protein
MIATAQAEFKGPEHQGPRISSVTALAERGPLQTRAADTTARVGGTSHSAMLEDSVASVKRASWPNVQPGSGWSSRSGTVLSG